MYWHFLLYIDSETQQVVEIFFIEELGHFNMKMPSYQYRYSLYENKTVSRPCYLYNGNTITWTYRLYIEPRWRSCRCLIANYMVAKGFLSRQDISCGNSDRVQHFGSLPVEPESISGSWDQNHTNSLYEAGSFCLQNQMFCNNLRLQSSPGISPSGRVTHMRRISNPHWLR